MICIETLSGPINLTKTEYAGFEALGHFSTHPSKLDATADFVVRTLREISGAA